MTSGITQFIFHKNGCKQIIYIYRRKYYINIIIINIVMNIFPIIFNNIYVCLFNIAYQ